MYRIILAATSSLLLISIPSACALEVYGNGVTSSSSVDVKSFGSTAGTGFASPFSTGSSSGANRYITDVRVLINSITDSSDISVRIYPDSGTNGSPTSTAIASASYTMGTGAGTEWIFLTLDTPVQLAANSNYYLAIVLTGGSGTNFDWGYPDPSERSYGDLGSGSGYFLTSGGSSITYTTTDGGTNWTTSDAVSAAPFGFQIVPEPSTYALAGIASAALGLTARRRKPRSV